MKRVVHRLGWLLFGITLIVLIGTSVSKNAAVDFRGYVTGLKADAQNDCTWVTISEITDENSHITLKVPVGCSVKDLDGKAIAADQIDIGELIDADIKGELIDGTYYQAKRIKAYS